MNKIFLKPDETVDELLYGELKIIQKRRGWRYSVDALLLADFVLETIQPKDKILDLGCGAGVISLILARRSPARKIIGVEIQKALAGRAQRNVRLNHLEKKITILHRDARKLPQFFPQKSFDLIVSNPPFRKVGSGYLSPEKERAIARYELKLKMPQLIQLAEYLLKPNGRLALVYPIERLKELLAKLEKSHLKPSRLRFAYHKKGETRPVLFCLEARRKSPGLLIQPPWYIETEKGRFHLDRDKHS